MSCVSGQEKFDQFVRPRFVFIIRQSYKETPGVEMPAEVGLQFLHSPFGLQFVEGDKVMTGNGFLWGNRSANDVDCKWYCCLGAWCDGWVIERDGGRVVDVDVGLCTTIYRGGNNCR